MDDETKAEFKEVKASITNLEKTVDEHLNYSRGLEIPERVFRSEKKIQDLDKKKASWVGLYMAVGALILIVGIVLTIAKGI